MDAHPGANQLPLSFNSANGNGATIVVSIFLVVFAAFFLLFWRPKTAELSDYRNELSKKQAELTRLERDVADWPDTITREKLTRYEEELVQLWKLIPSEEEVSDLLREIEAHARASNLEIISLTRTSPDKATRTTAPKPGEKAPAKPKYVKIPYKIALGGNYYGLISFMRKLEDSNRLVTVASTSISAGQGEYLVDAEVQFNIFYSRAGV